METENDRSNPDPPQSSLPPEIVEALTKATRRHRKRYDPDFEDAVQDAWVAYLDWLRRNPE